MKNILVIGMSRFGKHLAAKLSELGNDVMIADRDERVVNELAPLYTNACVGDCTNPAVLKGLGVNNFDVCFVTIGDNFQSSLEITSLLKDFGAKHVVSKANRDIQAKFLARNGADEVVYPERDMAEKVAIKHNATNIFDYIELTEDYAIFEISIAGEWVGKRLNELAMRQKYHLNVLAIKKGNDLSPLPSPEYVFAEGDHAIVIGKPSEIFRLSERKRK